MKNFTHELLQSIKILLAVLFLSMGVQYAFAWTGPTQAPPSGNTPAPINVSATSQIKSGDLWARAIGSDNGYCIGSSCITAWPSGSGVSAGSGNLLGAWETRSANTVYQATTDGFVSGYLTIGQGPYGSIEILTDSSNPPTTVRVHEHGIETERGEGQGFAVTSPVRKNDYWKVNGAQTVYWIPLGN